MTMTKMADQPNPANGAVIMEPTSEPPASSPSAAATSSSSAAAATAQQDCQSIQLQHQPPQPQQQVQSISGEQNQDSRPQRNQQRQRKPPVPLVPPTQHEDWIDVTSDGGVKKHITIPASSARDLKRTPNEGARVRISYSIKLEEGHVICDNLKQETIFGIGSSEKPLPMIGFDKALLSMHAGETADLRIAFPYGYGENTLIQIKSISRRTPFVTTRDTVLYATIRLVSYERNKAQPKSFHERLDFIEEDRELGNDQFKNFNQAPAEKKKSFLEAAIRCYNRAQNNLIGAKLENETEENIKLYQENAIALYSNMALVHLKNRDEVKCIEFAEKALEIDPNHAKSIFRRGLAHMDLCRWDDAERDFRRCLELVPNDPAVKKSCEELAEHRRKAEKKSDRFFKHMFQNASGSLYDDAAPLHGPEFEDFEEMRKQGRQVWFSNDDTFIL